VYNVCWKASYALLVVLIIASSTHKLKTFLLIAAIEFYLYIPNNIIEGAEQHQWQVFSDTRFISMNPYWRKRTLEPSDAAPVEGV
jgi:hypothetical protein